MSSEETQGRLQSILVSLSKSRLSSVTELTNLLNSLSNSALSEPHNQEAIANAFQALSTLSHFIASSSLTEEIFDALSFDLPAVASRFGGVSDECAKIVAELIDRFVTTCNPRDMLSILCEAMAYTGDMVRVGSAYYVSIMRGISKVFISIQRRHFEQMKSALPVVLNIVKALSLEPEDENEDLQDLFVEALRIGNSIKEVCTKVEVNVKEKLRALLGLYVLQIMAVASFSNNCEASLVEQLSSFLPYCGSSYIGLLTGYDVNNLTSIVVEQSEDDFTNCLSYINHGASLAVIWGYIHGVALHAAKEDLVSFEDKLRKDHTKRWQAIGALKHVLAVANLPWKLKKQAIEIVLSITSGNTIKKYDDEYEDSDCSEYVPSLFASLKAIQSVIMFSSDSELRIKAYEALKNILADVPSSSRFDILKALINNSDSPSMIAILLDIVKSELNVEYCRRRIEFEKEKSTGVESKAYRPTPFWSFGILELVEQILRPSIGGPPILPEQNQSVHSALNLYHFVLMIESKAKTNYSEALSKDNLQKALKEWLLPLRALVTGIMTENNSDYCQVAVDTVCAINPVELVMYNCIELVEENLNQLS